MELQEVHKDHSAPSLRTIHYWVNSTKDGSFKLEKKVSSGRPRSSGSPKLIEEVNKLITEDPRLSTYQLAALLRINQSVVYRIIVFQCDFKTL